jgi:hypothetical protein
MQHDDGGHTQPAQFTAPAAPAPTEHNPEAERIQKQIADLQRQLTIAQQAQSPTNPG